MIGKRIGNFQIVEQIGSGGMGAVYLAEHQRIGTQVAIKVLRPELGYREELVKRFFNEAKAITALKHPSIVAIHDFGVSPDKIMYIVMEYLQGETLGECLRRDRALPWERAVSLARQVASALAVAHKQKIVHRDLKPDNLFLVKDPEVTGGERIKLLDFGVAKFLEAGATSSQTLTGQVLGTPAYMAPEQCASDPDLDGRVDLYAIGCILFHAVCGRPPFGQANTGGAAGVLVAQLHDAPPKPRQYAPLIPRRLEDIILRLLEKKRENRYGDARSLIEAFDKLLGRRGDSSMVMLSTDTGEHAAVMPETLDAAASASYNGDSFPGLGKRKSSRTPIIFGFGMLFAACAVAGFLFKGHIAEWMGDSSDERQSQASAVSEADDPRPVEAKKDADEVAISVTIDSRPTGAQLFSADSDGDVTGEEALGVTPFTTRTERGGAEMRFVIRADGHDDHAVVISGEQLADREPGDRSPIIIVAEMTERESAETATDADPSVKQVASTKRSAKVSARKKSARKKSAGKKSVRKKSAGKKSARKKSSKKKSGNKKFVKKKSDVQRSLNPFD